MTPPALVCYTDAMKNITANTRQFMHSAWTRDGRKIYYGEALLLALLTHTKSADRQGEDAEVVRKIMKDINL